MIVQNANPAHGDTPYTRQLGGCGDVGEFIHLTPFYVSTINEVSNQENYGKPGNTVKPGNFGQKRRLFFC